MSKMQFSIQPRAMAAVLACSLIVAGCVRPAERLRDPPKFGLANVPPAPAPLPTPVAVPARGPVDLGFREYSGNDAVYFGKDSADLDEAARTVLDRQAEWLVAHAGIRAELHGHADELGTRESRFALAERRAAAMRFHLIARGVAADRLKALSFGKELAVAGGWGDQDQKANRRGQTVLIGAAVSAPAR